MGMTKFRTQKENEERDAKLYFVEGGDTGFSPKRNEEIIERTIQKAELLRKQKRRRAEDNIRQRADAVATYLKSRIAEGSTPVEKYFGMKEFLHLQGRKHLEKLIGYKNGQPIYKVTTRE